MSIVEKLRLALSVIEEYKLKRVIDVDIYKNNEVSIHVHGVEVLEDTGITIEHDSNDAYESAYIVVRNVKVFTVTKS